MKKVSIFFVVIAIVSVLCAHDQATVNDLSNWNGNWQSCSIWSEDSLMMKLYEKAAEKADGWTAQEIRDQFAKMYHTDFSAITVQDNHVVFQAIGRSKASVGNEYQLEKEIHSQFGEHTITWYVFKAFSGNGYDYLALLPVHKDEGSELSHFHFRYGNGTCEDLLENPASQMWWPTMFTRGVTAQDFYDDMVSEIDELVEMLNNLKNK